MILPLMNYDAQLVCCQCNIKQRRMENSYGNVSNVESNILFLIKLTIVLKRVGVLLDENMSEIESLKSENQKLRNYISLVLAEIELTQRVSEIKQNFVNSSDSERIIMPIIDKISKIKSEKLYFEKELHLN